MMKSAFRKLMRYLLPLESQIRPPFPVYHMLSYILRLLERLIKMPWQSDCVRRHGQCREVHLIAHQHLVFSTSTAPGQKSVHACLTLSRVADFNKSEWYALLTLNWAGCFAVKEGMRIPYRFDVP
jgi:hypothetical protein